MKTVEEISIAPWLPKSLPEAWERLSPDGWDDDGAAWDNRGMGLRVILSVGREEDDRLWLHASVSRRSRVPTYEDLAVLRNLFLGNRKAVMVFPEERNYVNIHPYCLHLFAAVDHDPLPEFSRGGGTI